jgi:hypothetical protein
MKKILIIVMSHNSDDETFKCYKKFWDMKKKFIENKFPIDILFLYSDENITNNYEIHGDSLISKCQENYWDSLLIKTINGLEYFFENDYDLIFKTNLSTFINFNSFYDFCLKKCLDDDLIYEGVVGTFENFRFVSGAGMLLNKKTAKIVLDNRHLITNKWTDDIFLGYILNGKNNITPNKNNLERYNLITKNISFNFNDISHYTHIRVKVRKENWDCIYFDKLFNMFYS